MLDRSAGLEWVLHLVTMGRLWHEQALAALDILVNGRISHAWVLIVHTLAGSAVHHAWLGGEILQWLRRSDHSAEWHVLRRHVSFVPDGAGWSWYLLLLLLLLLHHRIHLRWLLEAVVHHTDILAAIVLNRCLVPKRPSLEEILGLLAEAQRFT